MLSIRFGVPNKYYIHWLCPAACSYLINPLEYENAVCSSSWEEVDGFLQRRLNASSDLEEAIIITRALRVPDYDAEGNMINRHAHTYVVLVIEKSPKSTKDMWSVFHWNLKAINFLYSRHDIPKEITRRLETLIWRYSGWVRHRLIRMTDKIVKYIAPQLAEKMYAPDYVWRTGEHTGKSTIQKLTTRWENHIMCM